MGNTVLQQGEFDLLTANMVVNHLTTPEYDDFIRYIHGALALDGYLMYSIPHPEEKSQKHKFDVNDNTKVVEEAAPWGGMVAYHHRSIEYQENLLEKHGFEVTIYEWGYESFLSSSYIDGLQEKSGKNLRGLKRMLFEAIKRK